MVHEPQITIKVSGNGNFQMDMSILTIDGIQAKQGVKKDLKRGLNLLSYFKPHQ